MSAEPDLPFDEEWEEWDGSSPFWVHCVAGSLAGVAEHTLVYPLDTVRTHIQVCAACNFNPNSNNLPSNNTGAGVKPASLATTSGSVLQKGASAAASATSKPVQQFGMWQTMRHLVSQPLPAAAATTLEAATAPAELTSAGVSRLWRGVHTILIGCIPAHALYFSSYEMVKAATLDANGQVTTYGSVAAGAAATFSHDLILGPLDTVKQRLQLGHYRGLTHAMQTMLASEGWFSLFRSFPVTLATNVPYGMVMVGTNEYLKQLWTDNGAQKMTLGITLSASSLAGLTAAATTTPLDRIKTYLQTQQLEPACGVAKESCPLQSKKVVVANWQQAAARILEREGPIGFFRGLTPRILSHTPAVAISWTTYETAKQYLTSLSSSP
jgi:solute carrier family 25 (mitochondrial iron transporter), member 28/37